jgi:hypothetical protein
MRLEMRDAIHIPQTIRTMTSTDSAMNQPGARANPLTQVLAKPGKNPPTKRMMSDTQRIGL